MFHTPPINPDRSDLSDTATLESYKNQTPSSPECHAAREKGPADEPSQTDGSNNHNKEGDSSGTSFGESAKTENLADANLPEVTRTEASPSVSAHSVPIKTAAITSSSSSSINGDVLIISDTAPTNSAATNDVPHTTTKSMNLEYAREVRSMQLPKELTRLISAFLKDLQAPKYSQPLSTDQVALLFQQFYLKFDECSMVYLHKLLESNDYESLHQDYVEHMEYSLCANKMIFNKIFQNNVDDLKIQVNIYEKVYVLRNIVKINLEMLDLDLKQFTSFNEEEFKNDLKAVEKSFNKANYLKSPLEKLIVFSNSFELLVKLINKHKDSNGTDTKDKASLLYVNADILIPVFIYFIVHKHVENLYLNYRYIRRFKHSKFWIRETNGIFSYNMTNIEALLTYLVNLDYKRDLDLSDENLQKLFNKFKASKDNNINADSKSKKFNEFKEERSELKSHHSRSNNISNRAFTEKKKLIERLDQFHDEDSNVTFFDNITLKDLQKILSPFEEARIDGAEAVLPPPPAPLVLPAVSRLNGRKKSNSITLIKNTLQESLLHYHNNLNPSSSNSSMNGASSTIRHSSLTVSGDSGAPFPASSATSTLSGTAPTPTRNPTFSDAALGTGGLVLNAADQGFKNLSSVFDSSLKFLGNRMSQNNSTPNLSTNNINSNSNTSILTTGANSLSSILGSGNRSRSNSANSHATNNRNRSNSALNSIFNSNNGIIKTINENGNGNADSEDQRHEGEASNSNNLANATSLPTLNKFMRWRTGSQSGLSSPSTSAPSINNDNSSSTAKPDDASISSAASKSSSANGHSRSGSLSIMSTLKSKSPKLLLLGNANLNDNDGRSSNISSIHTSATLTNARHGDAEEDNASVVDLRQFKKVGKQFNELSIKELQEVYSNYNLLVEYLSSRDPDANSK